MGRHVNKKKQKLSKDAGKSRYIRKAKIEKGKIWDLSNEREKE
jgi:hypothetical protein